MFLQGKMCFFGQDFATFAKQVLKVSGQWYQTHGHRAEKEVVVLPPSPFNNFCQNSLQREKKRDPTKMCHQQNLVIRSKMTHNMGTQSSFQLILHPIISKTFLFFFLPQRRKEKKEHTFLTESLKHNAFHKGAHMPIPKVMHASLVEHNFPPNLIRVC